MLHSATQMCLYLFWQGTSAQREAYQEANQDATEMAYEGGSGNDDGRQDEGGKRGEVHGNVAKAKDAKTGAPAHC